jgi:hypothetical protein
MAVYFETDDPSGLLAKFNARIDQKEPKGRITTWKRISDGKHYTHVALEWTGKAYFLPKVERGKLTFNIIKPQSQGITDLVYAYYHGHLIETFLAHFDKYFSLGSATALAADGDKVA